LDHRLWDRCLSGKGAGGRRVGDSQQGLGEAEQCHAFTCVQIVFVEQVGTDQRTGSSGDTLRDGGRWCGRVQQPGRDLSLGGTVPRAQRGPPGSAVVNVYWRCSAHGTWRYEYRRIVRW
jgi:hypothetical protein